MSDYYVDAAKAAHAAASCNLSMHPCMSHEQEIAVWKQALLEQKERAELWFTRWVAMTTVCLFTNMAWAIWTWWPR